MDVDRVGRGERIAAISAIVLFLLMILVDWFGAPGDVADVAEAFGADIDTGANAFQAFDLIDLVLLLTVIAAVGVAVIAANASDINLPVAGSAIVAALGILSVVLILYRIIDPPSGADRELGVFLGLIAAGGVAYGGWVGMEEEGTSLGPQGGGSGDRTDGEERRSAPPPSGS